MLQGGHRGKPDAGHTVESQVSCITQAQYMQAAPRFELSVTHLIHRQDTATAAPKQAQNFNPTHPASPHHPPYHTAPPSSLPCHHTPPYSTLTPQLALTTIPIAHNPPALLPCPAAFRKNMKHYICS